ncbi:hypothetical protein [Aurantimonas coralicida]|uniref:hypothetical protein n=1 Tax=Aurantimonas coralicida TaxID=182270 RepID=UPI001D17D6AE|nr:hypothetical protein [Aurantimonas coralicida]MCC4300249.1 hypothetical protein [Aurantimonas coralicida]
MAGFILECMAGFVGIRMRTFGVLFGKRVGGFEGRADEIIAGELDVSPEMRLIAGALMKARSSVLDQIRLLEHIRLNPVHIRQRRSSWRIRLA